MSASRIAIIDDHDLLAVGVAASLSQMDGVELAAASHTVDEFLDLGLTVDLVLLDLRLGDGTRPARNVALLRATGAEVLAYTSAEDASLLREAAKAEVIGVVTKSAPPSELIESISAALRGEVVASVDWAAAVDSDGSVGGVGLTPRELEVLELYASGEKADRVARLLGISRETVLDHIQNIRSKYAEANRPAHTKVDLYRRAVEDGILRAPPA